MSERFSIVNTLSNVRNLEIYGPVICFSLLYLLQHFSQNVMELHQVSHRRIGQTLIGNTSYDMYFPSAGRCQEVCLESNYFVFGVQVNRCVCLEQIPGHGSRGANVCSLSCPGNYSAETNIKFIYDCGGHQTYNLFKSGTYS
uniref:WSC domain-containing protein n=1 Tax=Magallana gigas TaxID=29159 RepID=A0A8W8LWS0_MAGGI